MRLATQQASRDEELTNVRRQLAELEEEVADLQSTLELHQEQAGALKEVCVPAAGSFSGLQKGQGLSSSLSCKGLQGLRRTAPGGAVFPCKCDLDQSLSIHVGTGAS